MSPAPVGNADSPGALLHVGLVAGPRSLAELGPVVRHLTVGLLDQPMRVTLVHPAGAAPAHLPSPPVGMVNYAISRVPLLRNRQIRALVETLQPLGLDLLHGLDCNALPLTRRLAAGLDLDYLIALTSLEGNFRFSDPHCRYVLAASEPIRELLLASSAVPDEAVVLLRPGVHRARKATCFTDPSHAPALVAAGEFTFYPAFAAVLEAFAGLLAARRDCVFFLVGGGRHEAALRRRAEALGLMHDLTFVDLQSPEQLQGILRGADVFICPVPSQRIEVRLLAAMAAGVPVVCAENPAADFVMADRTALTFQAGDAGELAVKLKALLDDRAAARSLAENALALLRENHSPARVSQQLAEIYRAVVSKQVTSTD